MNDDNELNELNPPVMDGYTKIPTFKLWVANRFPYIETDFDGITSYELLEALTNYLNNVIKNEENVESNVAKLNQAYLELFNYVKNYFDNLDVQEEINNKLDDLVADGTLTRLIGEYVQPLIDEQNETIENFTNSVNNQIANQNTQIQAVVSGSPKATYDTLAQLQSADPDHNYIYVVRETGNWYYYSNNQWNSGGSYLSESLSDEANYRIDLVESEVININDVPTITGFVASNGYFNPLASCKRTDYIDLKAYDKITYHNYLANNGCSLAFFDEDKQFMQDISIVGTGSKVTATINRPATAKYVILSNYNTQVNNPYIKLYKEDSMREEYDAILENQNQLQNVANILKNKKIGFLGDSITNGYLATLPFRTIIQNKTGCVSVNYGINSSTLSDYNGGSNPVVDRYTNMDADLDYVCVLIGTNDTCPIGTETDTDTTTFYGALNTLIEGLITRYTTKRIMFMTLLPRRNANLTNKNTAIKNRCSHYSIPCFDLFNYSGMNPNLDIVNTTLFANSDGLHPNNDGHLLLSNKIQKWLESI